MALVVAIGVGACLRDTPITVGPTAAAQDTSKRDLVLEPGAGTVQLEIGRALVVRRPPGAATVTWTAEGADDILERLEPASDTAAGPDGWKFRARAAGEGELIFTGHGVASCPDPERCPPPPAPPTIRLMVRVTK